MANEPSPAAFLLSLGLAFISAAIGHAMARGYRNWRVVVSGTIGLALSSAALLWSRISAAMDERLVSSIGRVASNADVWLTTLFALWLYLTINSLVLLYQRNRYGEIIERDMNPFRLVLQRLVIPRSLTPQQIETIGSYLSKFPGYPVTYKINKNDQEATRYSRYLQKALQQGGWNTVAIEHELI